MWKFIEHKVTKLGCLCVIALMMVAATAGTKLVLGWFHYDDASKEALSGQIGEYVGKGVLGLAVVVGFILMGRQFIAELRGKNTSPPPLPPELPQGRNRRSNDNNRDGS